MADRTTRKPPIQPVSRERKKAAALKECRCFEEVERRLRMGHSSAKLVKFIQEDSGELTHLSPGYIRKMIDEHRKTIPPVDLALTSKNTAVLSAANRKIANGLNELEELEVLYTKQKRRIEIEMGNEEKINKLLPQTGREIFYAMKILKQSADLKMDLGIAKRQLGEVSVTGHASVQIGERYHDGIGGVMSNPDSRRKVLGMVQTLAALSEKANMDVADVINSAANVVGSEIIDITDDDVGTETEQ
jgi:hypothetical protein